VLDLRRLRVLSEVARQGSLSAAARALSYTQPAVSHHIARLEEEVGTALITRLGRGVRLTDAGQALVEHAHAILSRVEAAEEEVAAIAGLSGGSVRLAAFPSASATLIPPAIAQLKRQHPAVRVSLIETEPPEALALLRAGECDVALVFEYPTVAVDEGSDFVKLPLLDEPLYLVLPDTHRLASSASVSLRKLKQETWIAGCPRCRRHLLHACAQAGFEPKTPVAIDDYVATQNLVAAGLGVTLLPALALTAFRHPKTIVRSLTPRRMRAVSAVVAATSRRPPAVSETLKTIQDAADKLDLRADARPTG
jgi:molybdate transport repressor ModE-like protein